MESREAAYPVGNVFNVPIGAAKVRVMWTDQTVWDSGIASYGAMMVLAGPTLPTAYQAFDPDSRYGEGGVKAGVGQRVAFYDHAGAIVSASSITSDGVNLSVPGNADSKTQTGYVTFQAPSGKSGGFGPSFTQDKKSLQIQGPGRNFGNAGGWSVGHRSERGMLVSQRGIHQLLGFNVEKHGVGDTAGIWGMVTSDGGIHGQSDEGVTGLSLRVQETTGWFHGRVVSSSGCGDIRPIFKCNSGPAKTSDGAFMLNISKGTVSGKVVAPSQRVAFNATANIVEQSWLNFLPITPGCLPISEAIGICDSGIPANEYTADAPQLVSVVVRLVKIGGVPKKFTAGSYVSVASNWFPEQARLLSVVDNADGTQTLTMMLRNCCGAAVIFQNGIAGQYISFDANTVRASYFAFRSLTGNDLIYGLQVAGGVTPEHTLPVIGSENATNDGGPDSIFRLFPARRLSARTMESSVALSSKTRCCGNRTMRSRTRTTRLAAAALSG